MLLVLSNYHRFQREIFAALPNAFEGNDFQLYNFWSLPFVVVHRRTESHLGIKGEHYPILPQICHVELYILNKMRRQS